MSKLLIDSEEYYRLKKDYDEIKKKYFALKKYNSAIESYNKNKDVTGFKNLCIDLISEKYKLSDIQIVDDKNENITKVIEKLYEYEKELNEKEITIKNLKANLNAHNAIKEENVKLKTNLKSAKQENIKLNKMVEELETKNKNLKQSSKSNQTSKKFDIKEFEKEYNEFIKNLKEKKNETI